MREKFDYTSYARQFVARFPILNNVLTQVNFWVIANILLAVIIRMVGLIIRDTFSISMQGSIWPTVVVAAIMGILYGIALGLLDYFFDRQFFRDKPLGKIIILKAVLSLVVLVLIFELLRFVLFDAIIVPSLFNNTSPFTERSWRYLFYLSLIYNFFMTLVINFIIQVNKKYGPGVLLPLLLGKYRNPVEEERVFMFMDLKSSTTIAEKLGHMKYSSFIRDSFMDINQVLFTFNAEVYQYVGDEIVVCWKLNERLEKISCVKFYFACEKQFIDRSDYYLKNYGQVPQFKAGLHMGKVTAVEIGEIKRDIAYHGDTLNTAARIQSMCNEYGKKFLVSVYFLEHSRLPDNYKTEDLGMLLLKGKTIPIGIASIENPL